MNIFEKARWDFVGFKTFSNACIAAFLSAFLVVGVKWTGSIGTGAKVLFHRFSF